MQTPITQRITAIEGLIASLTTEVSNLKLMLNQGTASPPSLDEAILAALKDGPLTLVALYAKLPVRAWNTVYNAVKGTNNHNSLEKRGLVIHDKTVRPGVVRLIEGAIDTPRYVREIMLRDSTAKATDPVVQAAGAALEAYALKVLAPEHNGKRVFPAHLMKCIDNRGLLPMIEHVTGGKKPTEGFAKCVSSGVPEATLETVVLAYPDRFNPAVVETVKARMSELQQS